MISDEWRDTISRAGVRYCFFIGVFFNWRPYTAATGTFRAAKLGCDGDKRGEEGLLI